MRFYSGFALTNDDGFFSDYLDFSDYSVAGFSYGGIKAFEYCLSATTRIDKLQLFSPAFFQNKKESFKRLQLSSYKKDKFLYINSFLTSCFYPYDKKDISISEHDESELEELLYYIWYEKKLQELKDRGIEIEVYLGEKDAIIDSFVAKEFFLPFATTYLIKEANHFLQK